MIRAYQGVDIVEVAALRRVGERHERFLAEVFTAGERDYCSARADPFVHLAGRFAAKEAAMKALGLGLVGLGGTVAFENIEIVRRASGAPELALSGWAARVAGQRRVTHTSLSIAHSGGFAIATVLLLATPGEGR